MALVQGQLEAVQPGLVAAEFVAGEIAGHIDVEDVGAAQPRGPHRGGDLRVAAIDQFVDPVRLFRRDQRVAADFVAGGEKVWIAGDD